MGKSEEDRLFGRYLLIFPVWSGLVTYLTELAVVVFPCFGRTYRVTPAMRFCPRLMFTTMTFLSLLPAAGSSLFSAAMTPPP